MPFEVKDGLNFASDEIEIVSDRLLLRSVSDAYAGEIFHNFDVQVTRYMFPSPARRIEETQAFIRQARVGLERGDNLQFVILLKSSTEFLGCCGLHGQGKIKTPELGIWIKLDAHGHGYGREAITAVKHWVDKHLAYDYLIYPVDRANIPSRKIPEALGGEVYEEKLSPTLDGRMLDLLVYHIPPAR